MQGFFQDRHRYFGIRTDVAVGLGAMNVRERVALDILLQYLVDEDATDTMVNVRTEGWLSLWTLTGVFALMAIAAWMHVCIG